MNVGLQSRQVDVLMMQMKNLGIEPLKYIPLKKLREELGDLLVSMMTLSISSSIGPVTITPFLSSDRRITLHHSQSCRTSTDDTKSHHSGDSDTSLAVKDNRSSDTESRKSTIVFLSNVTKDSLSSQRGAGGSGGRGRGRQGRDVNWREAQETALGSRINNEKRIEYLLSCLEFNPEYRREQLENSHDFRDKHKEFFTESLHSMRSVIPMNIRHASVEDMTRDGLSEGFVRYDFEIASLHKY